MNIFAITYNFVLCTQFIQRNIYDFETEKSVFIEFLENGSRYHELEKSHFKTFREASNALYGISLRPTVFLYEPPTFPIRVPDNILYVPHIAPNVSLCPDIRAIGGKNRKIINFCNIRKMRIYP